VTPDEVFGFVRGAARLRVLRVLGGHVTARMNERNVQLSDIREAIFTATSIRPSEDGPNRWVLSGGADLDGHSLTVVVKVSGNAVCIVTTY
jgi:hypothetical protein